MRVCDRCNSRHDVSFLLLPGTAEQANSVVGLWTMRDLCDKCRKELVELLNSFPDRTIQKIIVSE